VRVLLAVKHFDFGGAENHVRELANALVSRGHRVWVAAPHGRQQDLLDPAVVHVPLSFTDASHPWAAARLASLAVRERVQLLHAHQRLPTLTALLAGAIAGRPVMATLHGQLQHDLTRWPLAAALLDRLIVVSPFFADLVARHAPALARKTVLIPNGIRPCAARPADRPSRRNVLYAARVIPRLDAFLGDLIGAAGDVAPWIPDLALHVAGDGPSLPRLREEARAVNAAQGREVVRFLGYVPDLGAAIADADLVLGVGRVAMEALMQGVPVLAANHRYLGGMVTRERYRALAALNFVPQRSPQPDRAALATALAGALAGLGRWTAEALALQPQVAEEYGVAAVARRIEAEYEAVVAGAASRESVRPLAVRPASALLS